MTRVEVFDASALAAILFGEPEAGDVARRLEGARLLAPTLLAYELANVAVVKTRRHPRLAQLIAESLAAAYLWLAWAEGAGLVTQDQKLQAAAAAP